MKTNIKYFTYAGVATFAHWISIWRIMDFDKFAINLKWEQKLSPTYIFISNCTCVHVEKSKHMNKLMKNATQIHATLGRKRF